MSALKKRHLEDSIINKINSDSLLPAFYDMETATIYLSRFSDGRIAPIHRYDGLPDEVSARAGVNVVSGFVIKGVFLTRQQAAKFKSKKVA